MKLKLIGQDSLVSMYIDNENPSTLYLQAFEDATDNIGHFYRYDLGMPYNEFINDTLIKDAVKFRMEVNDFNPNNCDAMDYIYAVDEYCFTNKIEFPYKVTEITDKVLINKLNISINGKE